MADTGSVLEMRRHFGHGMVTAFIRIEVRPIGVIANNPNYLSGAIDSPAADKATRLMQLCDNFDIPILSLCDTPGIPILIHGDIFPCHREASASVVVSTIFHFFSAAFGFSQPYPFPAPGLSIDSS